MRKCSYQDGGLCTRAGIFLSILGVVVLHGFHGTKSIPSSRAGVVMCTRVMRYEAPMHTAVFSIGTPVLAAEDEE